MSKHRRKAGFCPNCNHPLAAEDNFCPNCGQENHDLNVPFHHLAGEFIESIFHIDTKFWHTFKAIFTKPGKITSDFVAGKRASYMPPARLYIFVSFVFFLLVTVLADRLIEKANPESFKKMVSVSSINIDLDGTKIKLNPEYAKRLKTFSDKQLDSLLAANKVAATPEKRTLLKEKIDKFDKIINTWTNHQPTILVMDSVSNKMTKLDSAEINKIKNYSDEQLHAFLASKNTHPDAEDFQDFKDDLTEYRSDAKEKIEPKSSKNTVAKNEKTSEKNTINGIPQELLEKAPKHLTSEAADSILVANHITPTFTKRLTLKLYRRYKEFDYERDSREISHKFLKTLSYVMFLLMPFVAIILLTIYYRSKRNYYEYFIFSIHIHSVLFLAMSLEIIIRLLLKSDFIIPVYSLLIMYFYFLFSLKNVYRQGWIKTIFKFLFLNITYGIIFLIFFFGAALWSLATLE